MPNLTVPADRFAAVLGTGRGGERPESTARLFAGLELPDPPYAATVCASELRAELADGQLQDTLRALAVHSDALGSPLLAGLLDALAVQLAGEPLAAWRADARMLLHACALRLPEPDYVITCGAPGPGVEGQKLHLCPDAALISTRRRGQRIRVRALCGEQVEGWRDWRGKWADLAAHPGANSMGWSVCAGCAEHPHAATMTETSEDRDDYAPLPEPHQRAWALGSAGATRTALNGVLGAGALITDQEARRLASEHAREQLVSAAAKLASERGGRVLADLLVPDDNLNTAQPRQYAERGTLESLMSACSDCPQPTTPVALLDGHWEALLGSVISSASLNEGESAPEFMPMGRDAHRRTFITDRFAMGVLGVLADALAQRGVKLAASLSANESVQWRAAQPSFRQTAAGISAPRVRGARLPRPGAKRPSLYSHNIGK